MTERELPVLVGYMSFASKVVYGARTFTRLIDALIKLQQPGDHTRVTKLFRIELRWWVEPAPRVNGLYLCVMGRTWPSVTFSTDASFLGFGAAGENSWLDSTSDPEVLNYLLSFSASKFSCPQLTEFSRGNINFLPLIAASNPLIVRALWTQVAGWLSCLITQRLCFFRTEPRQKRWRTEMA